MVSVYSLTWLAGGLTAPVVGRLFDRYGPRTVYSLGLLLLGGAFLVASQAQTLWQFQLSIGLVRRDRHRLHRQRAEFDPARPLVRPTPADGDGSGLFRDRRGRAGVATRLANPDRSSRLARRLPDLRHRRALPAGAVVAAAVAAVLHGLAAHRQKSRPRLRRRGLDARRAPCAITRSGRCSATFFFTAVGMYALAAQIVAYLIDAGFPPLQAATAWGFSGVVLLFGMLGVTQLDGDHRSTAVGAAQLRHLDRRHHPALAAAVLSELLAARRLRRDLRQHDRLARAADHGHRDEDLSRRAGRHDLRHDLDRQRPWLSARRLGRRPDP